jgi:hypothetical protein
VILVKSERAAKRMLDGITRYVEEEPGLPVNREKSEASLARNIEFLGFQILANKIRVSEEIAGEVQAEGARADETKQRLVDGPCD